MHLPFPHICPYSQVNITADAITRTIQMAEETSSDSESLSESELARTVVLEFGSSYTRAGFSGQEHPSLITPSVVGRPRVFPGMKQATKLPNTKSSACGAETKSYGDVFVGDDAETRRGILSVKYPVEWGIITNWDDLEVLWQNVFEEKLRCKPEDTPLLIVEGEPMNPKANREKITQLAFETFRVPFFYFAPMPSLVLRAAGGRTTGLVVDIGEGTVRTVPVYDGFYLCHAVQKFPVGSRDFTDYLHKLLSSKPGGALPTTTSFLRNEMRLMKENVGYIAQDYKQESETFSVFQEKQYELPGEQKVITVGPERFQCVEPLFQPNLIGIEMPGLAENVVNTVHRCDADIREELLSNIVLTGGASLLPGLASRLQHDVMEKLKSYASRTGDQSFCRLHAQVVAPPASNLLGWKGGSLLASSPDFFDRCISLDAYDEYGPVLVHRKCF